MSSPDVPNLESLLETISQLQKTVEQLKGNNTSSSKRLHVVSSMSREMSKMPQRCTMQTNSGDVSLLETPTYDQIFRPPKLADRECGMLYGRDFLLRHCRDNQNVTYCKNHRTVQLWVKNNEIIMDLRHNKDEQQKIKDFIQDNYDQILPLKFPGATYFWKQEDVYMYYVRTMQASRKYKKRKSITSSAGSSVGSSMVISFFIMQIVYYVLLLYLNKFTIL